MRKILFITEGTHTESKYMMCQHNLQRLQQHNFRPRNHGYRFAVSKAPFTEVWLIHIMCRLHV